MINYKASYSNGEVEFTSKKEGIKYCVVKSDNGTIMAKSSSLELAIKARDKDERLYKHLVGILEVVKVNVAS